MTEGDDPELEYSPLCGVVTPDGTAVHVEIYRLIDEPEASSLEVINHEGALTVWDQTFTRDGAADAEFVVEMLKEKQAGIPIKRGEPGF